MIMQRLVLDKERGVLWWWSVEGTDENVVDCVTFFPLTVRVPGDVDMLYLEN